MNIIDICITSALVLGVVFGLIRGFVSSVARLAGGLGGLLLGIVFAPRILAWIQDKVDIVGPVEDFLRRNKIAVNWLGIYSVFGSGSTLQNEVNDNYQKVATWILIGIAFIIITLVVSLLASSMAHWIEWHIRGTPFTMLNRILGGVFGAIQSCISISIALIVMLPLAMFMPGLHQQMAESQWVERFGVIIKPVSLYLLKYFGFRT